MAHIDLGGHVKDHLGPDGREQLEQRSRITHVKFVQDRAAGQRLRQVCALAGAEVVDHVHAVTARLQRIDEVRPDEAGAAGDHALHAAESIVRTEPAKIGRARATNATRALRKDDPGRAGGPSEAREKGGDTRGPA